MPTSTAAGESTLARGALPTLVSVQTPSVRMKIVSDSALLVLPLTAASAAMCVAARCAVASFAASNAFSRAGRWCAASR